MMTVQEVLVFSFDPSRVGTFAPWVVALTGQCKTLLSCASGSKRAENHAKCVQRGQTGRWSINTKIKQLRRGASDQRRPLKGRRTSEVLADIETAVTETPRQTLSVLRRHSSLDMSRSMLWRAPHEDLQARCFKPVRRPRLTAENRLARLNFCRDVLQRVGVLSVRGERHLKPLDLTLVVFSDEKFFR